MTNYLNSLIAKNLSSQDNILPRPLFRFEPFPAASAIPDISELVQEGEARRVISEPTPGEDLLQTWNEVLPRENISQNFTVPSADSRFEEVRILPEVTIPVIPPPARPIGRESSSPVRIEPFHDSSPVQPDRSEVDNKLRVLPEPRSQPYRGRLDIAVTVASRLRSQPAGKDQSVEVSFHASPDSPLPSVVPDVQPETSRYQPLNPSLHSDIPPLRAQNWSPDSYPRENVSVFERIVERAVTPSIQPTAQSQNPENLPRELPVEPRVVYDLRPIVPPLPDLTSRNVVPQPTRTVNVTIGRIEVRAAALPPTLPRKPSSAPALMSLDEYLRSRVKGERQ